MSQIKDIKEQIGFLLQLQVLDGEIYALKREKQEKPKYIKTLEESLEGKKSGIKQGEATLKDLQVKSKEREVSLQQKEEQIGKLQTQLYQLKTNKEYSAMQTEIEGVKADKSLLEEDIIKYMDDIEAAKKKIQEEKEIFKVEEAKTHKEKDEINKRLKEIEARLTELSSEKGKIVSGVDKQILARYERVLKNREGSALASIEDGSCGGCHMNLPPQVISEVKLKENIIVCDSCLRILYIDDNIEIS